MCLDVELEVQAPSRRASLDLAYPVCYPLSFHELLQECLAVELLRVQVQCATPSRRSHLYP